MTFIYRDDPHSGTNGLSDLLDQLQAGDCIEVESFSCAAADEQTFLKLMEQLKERGIRFRSTREQFDTADPESGRILDILRSINHMHDASADAEAGEAAENAARGRKPINVDAEAFETILKRWRSGEITARQAMAELNLKPNTFYRRVKEKMPEMKDGEALLNAARQFGKDIAAGVQQEAADFQEAAGKFAADHELDNLSQNFMDQFSKSLTSAGSIVSRHVDTLTKDLQDALDRFAQKMREEAAAAENAAQPDAAPAADAPADAAESAAVEAEAVPAAPEAAEAETVPAAEETAAPVEETAE